jgi:3-hydroxyisobutyrate dehydrogenase-like beta-hydroxyacid dehydrogenase
MGGNMAANLLAAGHELAVTDIRKEIAEPLLANGATWADSAVAVAGASDVTMLSLPMPADVEKVVTADDGVLAGAAPGSTIIDLSTNSPSVVRALAVTAGEKGVGFLDAPVSGGVYGARKGTLAVMVGGDAELFEQYRPLFEVIGENVFHVGDVGAGNVAKLINNMLSFVCMLGTTEALVLGAKAGIDPVVLREVVKAGSGNSFMWDRGGRAILKDRLAPSFTVSLAAKDVTLATGLAREFGVDVPMGSLSEQLLVAYRDGGFADEDLLATVKGVEEQAGIVVRGRGPDL